MPTKLGIVAGGGDLPARLADMCRAVGRPYFVLGLNDSADPEFVNAHPHAWVDMVALGTAFRVLRQAEVTEIVLAGKVRRPSILMLKPDATGAAFLARAGLRALRGDDGLLSALVGRIEEEGFRVVAPETVSGELLAPRGPIGAIRPDAVAQADIARGMTVARAIGALDIGQGVVVQQSVVLGVEAIEGTDQLLARCAELRRDGPGGVLVKCAKPRQERRIDLPTLGVNTIHLAAAAGLRGIAVEAGGALIVDRQAVADAADAAGLFVVGIDPGNVDPD
jgi:UDP-2,3-diacylglucosamine hydrolase